MGDHIYDNMFQCSGSLSVYLTTFLHEAAAAAIVETLFPENPIAGLLGHVPPASRWERGEILMQLP